MKKLLCFLCGAVNTQIEAAGTVFVKSEVTFKCQVCGVRLRMLIPLVGFIESFHWSRPEDLTPNEVILAAHKWAEG